MNPDKFVVGGKYLILHNQLTIFYGIAHRGVWPGIYEYSGPESGLVNVERFEVISELDESTVGNTRIYDHLDIENHVHPYSNRLFEYMILFSTN